MTKLRPALNRLRVEHASSAEECQFRTFMMKPWRQKLPRGPIRKTSLSNPAFCFVRRVNAGSWSPVEECLTRTSGCSGYARVCKSRHAAATLLKHIVGKMSPAGPTRIRLSV